MEFFQPWHLIVLLFTFFLVIIPFWVIPFWQIFKKAGFPPALSLLMIFPLLNFILVCVLAFSKWNVVPAPALRAPDPTN